MEWTIVSTKSYADPFNDVDVDVVFSKEGQTWRVPTFWRGGERWTVRFTPPSPGKYSYRLESTDRTNPDLNGHEGIVTIAAYTGSNTLLGHGMLRVSADQRYFEYTDGTPFYWLGDTWWTGLSDRLSWAGFKELAADRKAKGFTVIQIVAGLISPDEEELVDPGYRNEGGAVWDPQFKHINPQYFDYADRRIELLIEEGLTPVIFGAWGPLMARAGVPALKKHWRYLIARYGAYPVIWVAGGEVFDPSTEFTGLFPAAFHSMIDRGWTEVTRYIRATDPYHHPLSVHERPPPFDFPVQDESLTDFDLFQSSHWGWGSIATEVAQMNTHYARNTITKPAVQGEIGYERLGEIHLEDFQRTAFWLAMLNGAAGFTYGANGVWEAYTADEPLQRTRWSFMTWEEGMNLPGSYQIGLGAKLLNNYAWWKFKPHPEWVTPRGTTLLEPNAEVNDFDIGRSVLQAHEVSAQSLAQALETDYPSGEWKARRGNFRLPYAAGIPGEVRFIYIPTRLIFLPSPAPTVLGLEPGKRYRAFFWEPTSGMRIDLGIVQRPALGIRLFADALGKKRRSAWTRQAEPAVTGGIVMTIRNTNEVNAMASIRTKSSTGAGLVLRYHDTDNYTAAIYSPEKRNVYLVDRQNGNNGDVLAATPAAAIGASLKLSVEVREGKAAASVSDGHTTYTTPIVDVVNVRAGSAGVLYPDELSLSDIKDFALYRGATLAKDDIPQRSLYDAQGLHRGDLRGAGMNSGPFRGAGWEDFGREKNILLDAYRPEKLPTSGDWLLVMEAQ